jgi:hypothetical protein
MRPGLAAAAAAVLLAAACGGDDEGGADDFRAEANAVCAEYGPRIAAVPAPLDDEDEWAALAGDIGDLLEAAVNELRGLEPPDDLGEDYGRWVDLKAEVLAQTRALQEAGAAHDEEAIATALAAAQEAESEADALAAELGLDDCATSESSLDGR